MRTSDAELFLYITGAPKIFKGKVMIGTTPVLSGGGSVRHMVYAGPTNSLSSTLRMEILELEMSL